MVAEGRRVIGAVAATVACCGVRQDLARLGATHAARRRGWGLPLGGMHMRGGGASSREPSADLLVCHLWQLSREDGVGW